MILIGSVAILGAVIYFLNSRTQPTAPILVAPKGATKIPENTPVTSVSLKWRQGGNIPGGGIPRSADRFVICLSRNPLPSSCGGAGSTNPLARRVVMATAISRQEIHGGLLSTYLPVLRPPVYAYDYPMRIGENNTPSGFHWTIAACAGELQINCSFADAPGRFEVTDVNLKLDDIDDEPVPGTIDQRVVGIQYSNRGTQDSGPFKIVTRIWRVRRSSTGLQALTDVTDPTVAEDDLALFRDGTTVQIDELTDEAKAEVRGIIPASNATPTTWELEIANLEGGEMLHEFEHPCGSPPCVISADPEWAPGTVELFAVSSYIDFDDVVVETIETDNFEYKPAVKITVPP